MLDLRDYILFLLSLKKPGGGATRSHIIEKAARDMKGPVDSVIDEKLKGLIDDGLVEAKKDILLATGMGRSVFAEFFGSNEVDLRSINPSWCLVYVAKSYYPRVAEPIVDLCRGRHVGFFCVFTGRHFFRRKFRGRYIRIEDESELIRFVQMHYVDVIPCVHRVGLDRPDWMVFDLDPGSQVPFEKTREVASITYDYLCDHGVSPALKFSGGRGFQIWVKPEKTDIPEEYDPPTSGGGRSRERDHFSLYSDVISYVEHSVREETGGVTTGTVGAKELRKDRVLLDPSSMKRMGLVRAPYSIHHRSGLVSIPVSRDSVEDFELGMAKPSAVVERFEDEGDEFQLRESDARDLLHSAVEWTKEYKTDSDR